MGENVGKVRFWKSANVRENPQEFAAIRKKKGQRRIVSPVPLVVG